MVFSVIVTGASRGVGYQIVKRLLPYQHIVYAIVRNKSRSSNLLQLQEKYPSLFVEELDITDRKKCNVFFRKLRKASVYIDTLIHNAASILFGPMETLTDAQLKKQFDVNFFAPVYLTNLFLPLMRKRKCGHILFVNTTSVFQHQEIYPAYSASKAALEAVAIGLAKTLKPWNIRVSSVVLSATKTDIAEKSLVLGAAFDSQKENPYFPEMQNNLSILKNVLINGEDAESVANNIIEIVENPQNQFRYPVTKKSAEALYKYYLDPVCRNCLDRD